MPETHYVSHMDNAAAQTLPAPSILIQAARALEMVFSGLESAGLPTAHMSHALESAQARCYAAGLCDSDIYGAMADTAVSL